MIRGEIWLATVGRKHRPVLILTRSQVIDVRAFVTVAEVTTNIRGIGAEVLLDHVAVGLERESAVNCDGLHTVDQRLLTQRIGSLDDRDMQRVCSAMSYALGS